MTDEEKNFGPVIAGLLSRLRQGELHAADQLWDVSSNMPLTPDQRQQLQKLVDVELDKLDQ